MEMSPDTLEAVGVNELFVLTRLVHDVQED